MIHIAEECLEEIGWAIGIGLGKGRTGHGAQAQMIQSPDVDSQTADAVSHALAASQVNEEQARELIPSRKCPVTPAGTVFSSQDLDLI